jgi:hypothetical protein
MITTVEQQHNIANHMKDVFQPSPLLIDRLLTLKKGGKEWSSLRKHFEIP